MFGILHCDAVKKPPPGNTLAQSGPCVGESVAPLVTVGSDSPTRRPLGGIGMMGDEGEAVGSVLPTALLI